tara:strand:- start:76 stop:2139 length:2064 start_codon:yes stop_codon:yes gene_type:complete
MKTVTMQDGRKIKFPDNMSPQEIEAVLDEESGISPEIGQPPPPPPQQQLQQQQQPDQREVPWQEDVKGFVRTAGSGMTFGQTDRLADWAQEKENEWREKFDMLPSPDSRTSKQVRDEFKDRNPTTALITSILSGVGNPVLRGAGNLAMAGKKLLPKIGKGSIVGGAGSGLQVVGESEGSLSERLQKGKDAAIIGAVTGGAIPGVVSGVSKGAKSVKDLVLGWGGSNTQTSNAARQISEALKKEGLTPKSALEKMKKIGPNATIADLGVNPQNLFYAQAARPGGGQKRALDWVNDRHIGTRDADNNLIGGNTNRVYQTLEDMPFGTGYHDRSSFDKAQKLASELYKKANDANLVIKNDTVDKLLRRPNMDEVMKKAGDGMRMEGKNVSQYSKEATEDFIEGGGKGKIGEGLKLEFLNEVKKVLWDFEEAAKNATTGKSTQLSNAYNSIRRELTEALDEADTTGFYREARKVAGDNIGNQRALDKGLKFMREGIDSKEMSGTLEVMTPHELHNFRVGAVQALKKTVENSSPTANATQQLMGKKNIEDRLKYIFGDKDIFKKYIDDLVNENQMYSTFKRTQGSQTGSNTATIDELSKPVSKIMTGYEQLKRGSPVSWLAGALNIFGGLKDKTLTSPGTSRKLSELLTGRDVSALEKHVIAKEMSNAGQGKLAQRLLSGASVGIGSNNSGR